MRDLAKNGVCDRKDEKAKKKYVKPSVEFVELRVEERISSNCKTNSLAAGSDPQAGCVATSLIN